MTDKPKCTEGDAEKMPDVIDKMTDLGAKELLNEIFALLSIGNKVRSTSIILINIDNAIRRSDCLSQIEQYHTKTIADENGEESEESTLNWGENPDKYIETYKVELDHRIAETNKHNLDALIEFCHRMGYSTGHGDTVADVLGELEINIKSSIAEAEERQRERCAKAFDSEYGDHSGENEYYNCVNAILNTGGKEDVG